MMDKPPQLKSLDQKSESKENLYNNFQKRIKRLALLGVTFGGMFLATQKAEAQEMKPGAIDAESMLYKMTEKESKEIKGLTKEVDSLTHVLQSELKGKVPVTTLDEFRDGQKISSHKSYIYKNVQVGAEGDWDLDYKGDTLKSSNNSMMYEGKEYEGGIWVNVQDRPVKEYAVNDPLSKESFSFGSSTGGTFSADHYTNASGKEYGGEMTSFDYGNKWKEKDAIEVEHVTEKTPENKFQQNFSEVEFAAEKDAGKKLEFVLKKLKDDITVAITLIRTEK
jgi:hypothetical protein